MKRSIVQLIAVSVLFAIFSSCGSSSKLTKSQKNEYGDEQYEVCSQEAEELGEENYFIGIGEGKSIDSQNSKKIAREEARSAIAEKMNSFVRIQTKNEEDQSEDPTSYRANRNRITDQLVSQKLQGLSTFCSKTFKNDEGLYTSFAGVKVDIKKSVFLAEIREQLSKN